MSVSPQENKQEQAQEVQKTNDKEYNFDKIRKQLDREQEEKQKLKEEIEKLKQIAQANLVNKDDEDSDDDEPYVDHKKLKKELGKAVKQTINETDNKIQSAVHKALSEERQKQWIKSNPDFYEIMQHAQAFADKDPDLAETILEMPEGFERQKLVYKNIKALGLHKKEEPKTGIQDKIEQNRRSPYYQPSGISAAPYAAAGDFTPTGQKTAYQKMQELKNRLRI